MTSATAVEPPGIAHVITGLATGGAEMMLWKLGDTLARRGWKQQVIALRPPGPVAQRLSASGIPVTSLGLTGIRGLRGITQLRPVVSHGPGDILHGWMYHGNLAALASRNAGGRPRPVIWGIRQSLYGLHREKRLTAALIRLGARLSTRVDAIVFNSSVSQRQHERIGYRNSRIRVIPNGFDVKSFHPNRMARVEWRARAGWPMDAVVVLMLAREHPMKNHAGFLRAVAPHVHERRELLVALAGREITAENQPLRSLALELGIADRVRFLGEVADTPSLLAASNVLCSASLWGEGFPNAVGEAMACGLPCVVTDVGDSGSLVGEAGFVVPPEEAALKAGLGRALALSPDEQIGLGTLGRLRIVERFSLDAVAATYERLYLELEHSRGLTQSHPHE